MGKALQRAFLLRRQVLPNRRRTAAPNSSRSNLPSADRPSMEMISTWIGFAIQFMVFGVELFGGFVDPVIDRQRRQNAHVDRAALINNERR